MKKLLLKTATLTLTALLALTLTTSCGGGKKSSKNET